MHSGDVQERPSAEEHSDSSGAECVDSSSMEVEQEEGEDGETGSGQGED